MPASETELEQFRAEKDHVFAHDPGSPLPADQRGSFKGLIYFAENPDLVIKARVDRNVEPGEVRMSTTGEEEQVYQRYGAVNCEGVGSGEGVGVGLADGLGNGVAVAPGTTTAEASGAAGMVTGDDGGEGGPRQSCCDGTTT